MSTDTILIEKVRSLVEARVGWGSGDTWTNQDFHELSEKILSETGVNLSATTLKRVWGRVKYDSDPSITTLDTLANFTGYENWRTFKLKEGNGSIPVTGTPVTHAEPGPATTPIPAPAKARHPVTIVLSVIAIAIAVYTVYSFVKKEPALDPADFSFSSKTTVTEGVPNTVIFDIDATKSPYDSVIVQQSWDASRQVKIPKSQRQFTGIYYRPNIFSAKLIVGSEIIQRHTLLIKSNGWLPMIDQRPVPVYFKKEEVISNGKMTMTTDLVKSKNITLDPVPPLILFTNVKDFGEIYADNFVFETSLKNDYKEGAGACQRTYVFLYVSDRIINIPLCNPGCVSDADLRFTDYYISGKKTDFSAFGVDFSNFVKVRIESANGKALIYFNDKLVHTVTDHILHAKIYGISIRFEGAGTVDYVKLYNEKVKFVDDF